MRLQGACGAPHLPRQRFDPITGLSNRAGFVMNYRPRSTDHIVVVTLCSSDQFDELLGAIGHEYAEDFVRIGARRLAEAIPEKVDMYHVGIVSFALLAPSGALPNLIRKFRKKFDEPILCGGVPISVDVAIGVADCPESDASTALHTGVAAARDCRDAGRVWARYDCEADAAHQRGFLLLTHLPAAIMADDQLHLHYQPKCDLLTGRTVGVEALLRWRHPVFGNIPPSDFVSSVEMTTHIHPLTEWVLRHAVAQAATWAAGGLLMDVAINISPRNLARRGFSTQFAKILNEFGISPARIELEFTEGVMSSNEPVILAELRALRATGVRIALDDFGTGFANFSYITRLPADIIKIDKSFIQKITISDRSAALVRSLINMAHELDYTVVAEGIESEAEYNMLRSWGCDEGQGYYMSGPVAPDILPRKLALEQQAGLEEIGDEARLDPV